MGMQVCMGAALQCSGGVAPSALVVLPAGRPLCPTPAATIADTAPFMNIPPFGMCTMLSNPAVAAATAAALGALTPMPCTPVPAGPWVPGNPKVLIANIPALTSDCKLMCSFGGVISIAFPGQVTVQE
jgi:hypothetical protein